MTSRKDIKRLKRVLSKQNKLKGRRVAGFLLITSEIRGHSNNSLSSNSIRIFLPLIVLLFQFQDLRLRHFGDGYKRVTLLRILGKNLKERWNHDSRDLFKYLLFVRLHLFQSIGSGYLFDEISASRNRVSNSWNSRFFSLKYNQSFDDSTKDIYDLEFAYKSHIVWRCIPLIKFGKVNKETWQSSSLTCIEIAEEPTEQVIENGIICEWLSNTQLLGGMHLVQGTRWLRNSSYDGVPKSLPAFGIVMDCESRIKRYSKSEGTLFIQDNLAFSGMNRNFYHFMIEILPRIIIASQQFGWKLTWIVPSDTPNQIVEIIQSLSSTEVRRVERHEVVFLERVMNIQDFRYSSPVDVDNYSHDSTENVFTKRLKDILLVKESLQKRFLIETVFDKSEGNKIFLTRSKYQERVPKHIEILESEARFSGYRVINLNETSFQSQIEIFTNADVISGLGGASFTNVMFCKAGTKVSVMSMADERKHRFWLDYGRLFDLEIEVIPIN